MQEIKNDFHLVYMSHETGAMKIKVFYNSLLFDSHVLLFNKQLSLELVS